MAIEDGTGKMGMMIGLVNSSLIEYIIINLKHMELII
jgi:hypothetical protein